MTARASDISGLSMKSVEPAVPAASTSDRDDAPCTLDRPVKLRVTCMHIRHKLRYVDERHTQRGLVDVNSDTRIFWCAKTQEALGPDDQPVGPAECSNGRGCYCHGG
jgi:hypothetical protein